MTEPTPVPLAPKPPRLTRADGCLGYFLGALAGVLVTLAWATDKLLGVVVSALGLATIVFIFRRATRNPAWVRMAWSMLIGLATLGLLFGLCVASFSHMDFR